ncbi:MAG: hypothetical protein RL318_2403, partial [Fibrobacterota bacterium]
LRWLLSRWPRGGDSRGLERLRHQVVERLTPQGKSLAALWLVLLAAAMVPRAPAGDIAFAVVSVMLGSAWIASLRRKPLAVRTRPPVTVREGETLELVVELSNAGARDLVEVGVLAARIPDALGSLQDGHLAGDLAAGAVVQMPLRFAALRRGRWSLAAPLGYAQEALGLARSLVRTTGRLPFLIAPARVPGLFPMPDPDRGASGAPGLGEEGEPFGIRPWREGDRLRDLHHRAWARTGLPHVRERESPRPSGVQLVVETGCQNLSERMRVEDLLRLGLAWAEELEARGRLGGLRLDGQAIGLPEGPGRREALLGAFASPPSPGWSRWHRTGNLILPEASDTPFRVVGVCEESLVRWVGSLAGRRAVQVLKVVERPRVRKDGVQEIDPTGKPA